MTKLPKKEWHDIGNAPLDGTEVLLWLGAPWSRVEKARFYRPWGTWVCGVIPSDPAREEIYGIGAAIPTHWQHLPDPPHPQESDG